MNESRYNGNNKQITDAGARALAASCIFLTEIQLSNTHVTDVGVEALVNSCSVLMTLLNLNDCVQVTDKGVQALARHCEHLRKVELRNTQVSDTGARALADWCDNLRQIDLNGTTVTPEAMQYMRLKLPRLTFKVSKCTSMMCVCRAEGGGEGV